MSPLDRESVQKRLLKLRDTITELSEYAKASQKEFMADGMLHDAVMYNLTVSIEAITDIGNHFLSAVFQKSAKDSEDILRLLGEVGVVPKKTIQENRGMAGFRNILVHEYADIDLKKVYTYLNGAPGIFQKFVDCYIKFLDKH